jgi:hypothetical protein
LHGSKRLLGSVAALALAAGSCVWSVKTRFRQAEHEKDLTLSWVHLGRTVHDASLRLGVEASDFPEVWELHRAADDPLVRARLDSLDARVWRELARRGREHGLDSLREALRRDREQVALALAHCRSGTRSAPSRWVLMGYPRR